MSVSCSRPQLSIDHTLQPAALPHACGIRDRALAIIQHAFVLIPGSSAHCLVWCPSPAGFQLRNACKALMHLLIMRRLRAPEGVYSQVPYRHQLYFTMGEQHNHTPECTQQVLMHTRFCQERIRVNLTIFVPPPASMIWRADMYRRELKKSASCCAETSSGAPKSAPPSWQPVVRRLDVAEGRHPRSTSAHRHSLHSISTQTA